MVYSYTQLSRFLACPRSYKYRYLDGWSEKETRASLLFGRAFEAALGAYFLHQDSAHALFRHWSAHRNSKLEYPSGESWDRMLHEGIQLLERFAQDGRVEVRWPRSNLQKKVSRPLSSGNEFVAYIDAIGRLDGESCLLDWKTTGARYPESPQGLLALDPQLLCYSWITGQSNVAFVVFVRKRQPEIQYLRTNISDEQRKEFERLVMQFIQEVESCQFPRHSGIRYPQNGCLGCPFLGLCLNDPRLIEARLVRRPGGDLGWIDELAA